MSLLLQAGQTITVKDVSTTTPIYIGDTPLGEDEYVDYGEQKVYRYGNNIFDSSAKSGANGYINDRYLTSTGSLQTSSLWYVSEYMGVEFKKYKVTSGIQSAAAIVEYDENKNFLVAHTYTSSSKIAFEVLSNCKFLRMSVYKNAESSTSLNALQPTDPPVPLPAIPTCDGTTIIDYDGTPKPSQMYVKYNSWSGWEDCAVKRYHNGSWEPCTEYVRRNGVWVQQT